MIQGSDGIHEHTSIIIVPIHLKSMLFLWFRKTTLFAGGEVDLEADPLMMIPSLKRDYA